MFKKLLSASLAVIMACALVTTALQTFSVAPVEREGSAALVRNGGSRPYLEWYRASTMNMERTQLIYVYAEAGETIYFGSSVPVGYDAVQGASIGVMMPQANGEAYSDAAFNNSPASYVGTASNQYAQFNPTFDASLDRSKVYFFKAEENTEQGLIKDYNQEQAGPVYNVNDVTYNDNGYQPFSIQVPEGCGGIWTFMYYSSGYTLKNPTPISVTNSNFIDNQRDGTVAAWDATVIKTADNGTVTQLSGRMACKTLFLNMGNNTEGSKTVALNSDVFVLTDKGFLYNVDFNGTDPYGFVFYANNRGVLLGTGEGNYQSLLHSAVSSNNALSGFTTANGTALSIYPNTIPTTAEDNSYYIFLNTPDDDFVKKVTEKGHLVTKNDLSAANIKTLSFIGNKDTGGQSEIDENGYYPATEGFGGTFYVTREEGSEATSFKVKIILTGNEILCERYGYSPEQENVITLSNAFIDGEGTVSWDGRDAYDHVVPASTYDDVEIEVIATTGEVHFPFLDIENNPNGIKVELLNQIAFNDESDQYTVYYNNVNDASGSFGISAGRYTLADGLDYSNKGVSSQNGALKYADRKGDQCVIDIWTYYSLTGEMKTTLKILVEKKALTSLTVEKTWNTNSDKGETDTAAPTFLELQLQQRVVGTTAWYNYNGSIVDYRTPVTLVTGAGLTQGKYIFANLEWHDDRRQEFEYRVVETPVANYKLVSDSAATASSPMAYSIDAQTKIKAYNQQLLNRYVSGDRPKDTVIYKYFYGYDDGSAGIFGYNDRYSPFNEDGYYYLNFEEAAAMIFRVREQEENLVYSDFPDISSFNDIPDTGWARKALEWVKDFLRLEENAGARTNVSAVNILNVFEAHYGNTKILDLTNYADPVLRIDFLRAYNKALGRTVIETIYSDDGILLCQKDADGNIEFTAEFINHSSKYIFTHELPTSSEELYQVMLSSHSYVLSENGTQAKIDTKSEAQRIELDAGYTEALKIDGNGK